MRACRFRITFRSMEEGGRILHRNSLWTGCLPVDFSTPKTRQDVTDLAVYDVTAIEFRGYLYRKRNFPPSLLHHDRIRDSAHKVAAKTEKGLELAGQNRVASLRRVHAFVSRRRKTKLPLDFIEWDKFWLFRNAHRALPLHVGMTADGKNVSAGLADVPPQKKKIADH